jgi:hypothetical protein
MPLKPSDTITTTQVPPLITATALTPEAAPECRTSTAPPSRAGPPTCMRAQTRSVPRRASAVARLQQGVGGNTGSVELQLTFDALHFLVCVYADYEVVAQRARLSRCYYLTVFRNQCCGVRACLKAFACPKWNRSKQPSTQLRQGVGAAANRSRGNAHSDLFVLLVVPNHIRDQKIDDITTLRDC